MVNKNGQTVAADVMVTISLLTGPTITSIVFSCFFPMPPSGNRKLSSSVLKPPHYLHSRGNTSHLSFVRDPHNPNTPSSKPWANKKWTFNTNTR